MEKMLGISGFSSTKVIKLINIKGKAVKDNKTTAAQGGIRKHKERTPGQYMYQKCNVDN